MAITNETSISEKTTILAITNVTPIREKTTTISEPIGCFQMTSHLSRAFKWRAGSAEPV